MNGEHGCVAIHSALMHLAEAHPAGVAATVKNVRFLPKLVNFLEALPKEIKISTLVKAEHSQSVVLNPEVSALNSTVASISTATAGGQVDQERLQKLTLHLRLLSALSSAHDIALGILVDKNSSAAVPNPGGGTSSGGAKISLKPDSFNYAPCHLSNEMLTADWSSSVGAAAAYNMESVSVAFNPRLENTPKSSQWMNKTGDQLHRPTFFPRAAAAAATTGATSGPHQAAHHNTQAASTLNAFGVSSYLVSVLKAVWPIAEALDAFCLEVIEFLKRILHKDGARNRVCHLLGPHSGNLVFNKMLIPHAMRGCCMVGKNGASLGVNGSQVSHAQSFAVDRTVSQTLDQTMSNLSKTHHRLDPLNDVTTTRALPSTHSSRMYAQASAKSSPISPIVFCRLLEVLSLSASGLTTNKASLLKFVSGRGELEFWFDLVEGKERLRLPVLKVLLAIMLSGYSKSFFSSSPRTLTMLEMCIVVSGGAVSSSSAGVNQGSLLLASTTSRVVNPVNRYAHPTNTDAGTTTTEVSSLALHLLWMLCYQNQRILPLIKQRQSLFAKLEWLSEDFHAPDRSVAVEIMGLLAVD
eukprot:g5974.t1